MCSADCIYIYISRHICNKHSRRREGGEVKDLRGSGGDTEGVRGGRAEMEMM